MPKIHSLLAWLLILPVTAVAVEYAAPDQETPPGDPEMMKMHNHLVDMVAQDARTPPLDIFFLGDSITEFWNIFGKDVWNNEYGRFQAINCGLRGNTTQNILYRINHGEFENIHPKVVVLLAGVNNFLVSDTVAPEAVSLGIQKIITTIQQKSPRTKILLISILPCHAKPSAPIRARILAENILLAKFADGKTVFFLDIYNRFLDANGNYPPDISADTVHLTAKGYQIWADAMRPKLLSLLEPYGKVE